MEHFSERLRTLREHAHLTQATLAEAAGVAAKTVVNAESRLDRAISPATRRAIVKALAAVKDLRMTEEEVSNFLMGPLNPPIPGPPRDDTPPADPERVAALAARIAAQREALANRPGPLNPPTDAERLAAAMKIVREVEKKGASRAYLESVGATGQEEPNTRVRPIPGGDDIAAGEPLTSSPDFDPGDAHQFLPGELFPWDDLAFFVRVRGNSMFPEFCDGDIVIGSPALRDQVESGDCVCVRFTQDGRFRGGRTLKRIRYLDDHTVRLESLNPSEKNVGEVRLTEIDEIGPCVMHIRALWKRHGYSVAELHKAHRVKASEPKAPAGEEPQAFPDYDGPQPLPEE